MSSSHPQGSDQLIGLPITPPATEADPKQDKILFTAVQVLSTEATALSHLSRLYATDPLARDGFVRSVEGITHSLNRGGKVVVVGVGKSGKIGQKLVATMNSLGLLSVFLHPVEALHGDLGILRPVSSTLLHGFPNLSSTCVQAGNIPAAPHMWYSDANLPSSRSRVISFFSSLFLETHPSS